MEQVNKPKYPTFQDKYGQGPAQAPTFEADRPEQPTAPQQNLNPWAAVQAPEQEQAPMQVELAPRPWEYSGK